MRRAAAAAGILAGYVLLFGAGAVLSQAQDEDLSGYISDDRRSGYTFLTPETRALQNDDFSNPGQLWVEQGAELWTSTASGPSCQSCHGDAAESMKGVAARYPAFDEGAGHVINLEQRINKCRTDNQKAEPLAYESQDLLSLTAFIGNQSRGMPVEVKVDGPAAASFAHGQEMFFTRIGQLDLSCASCHVDRVGGHLRGEVVTQGQINGFPIYRQLWQTLGSTHRMFAWCNEAVRAEPHAAGSQDYVDLELYERWRGRGLPVETPGVRR